jgi:hypothetical protein
MPTDNDTVFCPATIDSCYFLSASTTYNNALTRCTALGGAPVQWNNAVEQALVEKYFTVSGAASHVLAARYASGITATDALTSPSRYTLDLLHDISAHDPRSHLCKQAAGDTVN